MATWNETSDALLALFGGGKTVGMGINFDKDTYERAKPFFYDGVIHFKEFMHDVSDLGCRMIHYLKDVGG
jgi:hypothetical protein